MVEQCCRFVEQTPDLPIKLKLIDTLRTVTEGKVSYRWMFHYIYLLPSNWSQLFLLYLLFYLLTAPSVLLFFFHVLSPSPVTLLLSLSVSPSPYPPLPSSPVIRSLPPFPLRVFSSSLSSLTVSRYISRSPGHDLLWSCPRSGRRREILLLLPPYYRNCRCLSNKLGFSSRTNVQL